MSLDDRVDAVDDTVAGHDIQLDERGPTLTRADAHALAEDVVYAALQAESRPASRLQL